MSKLSHVVVPYHHLDVTIQETQHHLNSYNYIPQLKGILNHDGAHFSCFVGSNYISMDRSKELVFALFCHYDGASPVMVLLPSNVSSTDTALGDNCENKVNQWYKFS
jgi:O-glycosyl hydrolase